MYNPYAHFYMDLLLSENSAVADSVAALGRGQGERSGSVGPAPGAAAVSANRDRSVPT